MYNDCAMVAEPTRAEMPYAVELFLEEQQPSETALLYFSGHGQFCEADGQLYFLTRDADPDDLPGTAVGGVPGTDAPVLPGRVQAGAAGLLPQRVRRPGVDLQGRPGPRRPTGAQHAPAPDRRVLHHRLRRPPGRVREGTGGITPSAPPGSPARSWKACGAGGSRRAAGSPRTTSSSTWPRTG
ncbi:hypothetical protein [Streptomyces sp. LN699]|uniref:hypothetical protein n=1 Tax=Streptomyces sp. LN699 TaxID=3112981 RepID=UPI00371F4D97